ncbi:MAG: type II and III secretion system protein family protein [Rhizobiaceae bacterium]|nr:type II and III secretion system protein family protein [Rhizobiaceae bacterium]
MSNIKSVKNPSFTMPGVGRMHSLFSKAITATAIAVAIVVAQPILVSDVEQSGSQVTFSSAQAASDNKNYLKINRIGSSKRVKLGWNKSMVIDLPVDAHDIMVANPRVADAITRTSRRLYIFARQVGETNIFVFDADGRQVVSLDLVIERDIEGVEANIRKFVPGSNVKVEMINDNVILTGTVPTPQAATRTIELARVFVTGGEATTNQFNNKGGNSGSGTTIILQDDVRQTSQIVNLLQIEGEDQVYLKVTIAEIQRTIVKQLGINLSAVSNIGNIATSALTDYTNVFNKNISRTGLAGSWSNAAGTESIDALINAMDQAGVMRTLAEPTLTAISGETASFKVGGEFTVSDGKSDGEESVTYNTRQVEYGVGLTFTPTVLSPGRISLKIKTEVSEPTSEGSFSIPRGTVASAPIVSIRRREADTTVELPSGGSMVIAGLVKDDVRQSISGFPGLRKIPILGALFGSREFERYETELVIIVTPYLVRPVARQKLARPDDNFTPPSDTAGIFLGRVNRIYGTINERLPEGRYHGKVGFIFN